jgi:hypothetical protein
MVLGRISTGECKDETVRQRLVTQLMFGDSVMMKLLEVKWGSRPRVFDCQGVSNYVMCITFTDLGRGGAVLSV